MEAVTGKRSKSEVLQLAEMIIGLCSEHTSSELVAIAAIEAASKALGVEGLLQDDKNLDRPST